MPIPKDRTPDFYQVIPAASAPKLPDKRYPGYLVFVDANGQPIDLGGGGGAIAIGDVTGLQAALNAKLTASKAATQANSAAADVAGLVADFNALLVKLKTAGLMN
ncbi:hypothetical protein WMW72_10625 [Paenibacillus filicis]|uniref:Head fiber protein n=2 Tax=Paenibacillus filicis TaxID=669464 RepID=A0ABU9DHM2_9BACL